MKIFFVLLVLFIGTIMTALGEIDHGHIVYSRELALRHTAVLPEASSAIPGELLSRKRGCRAGVKRRGYHYGKCAITGK